MRRKVHVSSLSVGRCFTISPEDAEPVETTESAEAATVSRSVMNADNAWKVTAGGDPVSATNARGESREFAANTLVSEIPRQGFDRMAERG